MVLISASVTNCKLLWISLILTCPHLDLYKSTTLIFVSQEGKKVGPRASGLGPAILLKKRLWRKCFSCEFCEIKKKFLQNTSDDCFCLTVESSEFAIPVEKPARKTKDIKQVLIKSYKFLNKYFLLFKQTFQGSHPSLLSWLIL